MSLSVLAKVTEILEEVFGVDARSVSLKTQEHDIPGWDSVGHLSLCGALEDAFEIQFDSSELADMTSVRSIVATIDAKKGLLAEA